MESLTDRAGRSGWRKTWLLFVLIVTTKVTVAHASFMPETTIENLGTKISIFSSWNQGVAPNTTGLLDGSFWGIRLSEALADKTRLTIRLQHLAATHPDLGEQPNWPNPAVDLFAGAFPLDKTVAKGGGLAISTGKTPHFDVYDYAVLVDKTGASVGVSAQHLEERKFKWSLSNFLGGPAKLNVVGSYPATVTPPPGDPGKRMGERKDKPLKDRERDEDTFPAGASDYTIRMTRGDPTFSDMTLAFLEGSVGDLSEADLSLFTQAFVGDDEFFAAMLFDEDGAQNLFVAVDLMQWLSFGSSFQPGDEFLITNGVNPLLPGFLVSTSPIEFDPSIGFTTTTPANVLAVVGAIVDGQAVPTPSSPTFVLVAAGLVSLGLAAARRGCR